MGTLSPEDQNIQRIVRSHTQPLIDNISRLTKEVEKLKKEVAAMQPITVIRSTNSRIKNR